MRFILNATASDLLTAAGSLRTRAAMLRLRADRAGAGERSTREQAIADAEAIERVAAELTTQAGAPRLPRDASSA